MKNMWHTKQISEIIDALHTNEHGLTSDEAKDRLQKFGANKLPEGKRDSYWLIFLHQFQSPLIYVLLLASLILFLMGDTIDGLIILAVLFFNAAVGTLQEGKAQNTLLALKKFVETNSTVLRDNKEIIIKDAEIVPGDIIILQEGEKISADARIINSNNLKVDEAALTGESEPKHKIADAILGNVLPHDQKNMVFRGTYVLSGSAKAVVVTTGMDTVMGKISREIQAIDSEIPLKADIKHLSQFIVLAVVLVSAILFFAGILKGESMRSMFATVVALSVSVIPEGLPIVMTLVLATGVWRMTKHNALVKKLQAVEALGQAKIIAVDKTGTITKNEMVVQKVFVNNKMFEIGGVGYDAIGNIKLDGLEVDSANHPDLLLAGKISAFCSNARVIFSNEQNRWQVAGDPTEAAMLVFAKKVGFNKDTLEAESPFISEMPFDYKLKYHATIHKDKGKQLLMVAGAPESIIAISSRIWLDDKESALSETNRRKLESTFLEMSKRGLRVVALAQKTYTTKEITKDDIKGLKFIGFLGMKDALRTEVKDAMTKAREAGIKVVMITGDHEVTAEALAKEAGIFTEGSYVMTGKEINLLSDQELSKKLAGVSVFARVTPEHKLRIIKAYKAKGEIIAMTGDGVNDAPSLIAADLGVAMGKIGTEIAKEASDIVLLDDNFGSIVLAVEEGRNIYKTIKKVILYLLSTGFGEVITIMGAFFLGFPLPILPAQIIWLNLVTDSFLDVALAMEPKEKNLLLEKSKKSQKHLVDALMIYRMLFMALPMAIGVICVFSIYLQEDIHKAWTMSLTVLAVFQWFNVYNCRHESKSIFKMNPFSNKFLIGATVIVIALQLFAVYNPVMQKILNTVPLGPFDWVLAIVIASSIIIVEEVRKFFQRKLIKS